MVPIDSFVAIDLETPEWGGERFNGRGGDGTVGTVARRIGDILRGQPGTGSSRRVGAFSEDHNALLLRDFEQSGQGWSWSTDATGAITHISESVVDAPGRPRAKRRTVLRKVGVIHEDHRYEVMMRNLSRTGAAIAVPLVADIARTVRAA